MSHRTRHRFHAACELMFIVAMIATAVLA